MSVEERFHGANIIDAGKLSPYWGEHVARYLFALDYVKDRSVLDIACGTGYGVGLLQKDARFVVGVDVDVEAVRLARSECAERAGVTLGDGLSLPFSNATFDVITSFETLEHIHERSSFLSELRRVLKDDGVLVLSTPNALYSQPVNGKPTNPFHVFEYTPDQLRREIEQYFVIDRFVGQLLDAAIKIPPFQDAQMRLPKDIATQTRLFLWRCFNKIPFRLREFLSDQIWNKPFYPTEFDYTFNEADVESAPTQVVACRRK